MNRLVYLCGPITGCTYEGAVDWRDEVTEKLWPGITGLSPMRHKEYLLNDVDIADSYDEHIMSTTKAITVRDRFDTMRCDMLIANLLGAERVSIGSMLELGWADSKRIPSVVVMKEDNIHFHGMVREIAGWVVPTLEEAVKITNSTLVPEVLNGE